MMYGLGALALGAVVLAVYERRKKRRLQIEAAQDPNRNPARAAFTEAEKIRAETHFASPPHGGGIF